MKNFNEKAILSLSKEHDSFYLYDEKEIIKATTILKDNFKSAKFLYSIKTNPHKEVVKSVFSQGFGADAASLNEVKLSFNNGVHKEDLQFSCPAKTYKDIKNSIKISTIIADSLNEIKLIDEVAKEENIIANIGIRVNPDFTFTNSKGVASKFGIDEKIIFDCINTLTAYENINIKGLHFHIKSQELNIDNLIFYYDNIFKFIKKFTTLTNCSLSFVNFGSGIGLPYAQEDKGLDFSLLGKFFDENAKKLKEEFRDISLYIETGRFVVLKSGVYAAKVIDIKTSYNKKFVLLKNTLNAFIRPSLEQMITAYSSDENPIGSEPLFTSKDAFSFFVLNDETEMETVDLVGNLCTSTDVVKKDISLPKMNLGDMVVINNAGSYAAVLSPMQFSSQDEIPQIFITKDEDIIF